MTIKQKKIEIFHQTISKHVFSRKISEDSEKQNVRDFLFKSFIFKKLIPL